MLMDNEKYNVPIWKKITLTIKEASAYSGIGENKLYELTDKRNCDYVLFVGSKRLIKRIEFEKYISKLSVI